MAGCPKGFSVIWSQAHGGGAKGLPGRKPPIGIKGLPGCQIRVYRPDDRDGVSRLAFFPSKNRARCSPCRLGADRLYLPGANLPQTHPRSRYGTLQHATLLELACGNTFGATVAAPGPPAKPPLRRPTVRLWQHQTWGIRQPIRLAFPAPFGDVSKLSLDLPKRHLLDHPLWEEPERNGGPHGGLGR